MSWDGKLTPVQVARLLAPSGVLRPLRAHEIRFLFLIIDGLRTGEAAARLGIKRTSASELKGRIRRKLGLGSYRELSGFAISNGLV